MNSANVDLSVVQAELMRRIPASFQVLEARIVPALGDDVPTLWYLIAGYADEGAAAAALAASWGLEVVEPASAGDGSYVHRKWQRTTAEHGQPARVVVTTCYRATAPETE
jgi:hypothetical protein